MKNDEKIKFIRQKCIEANSSIVDLVFGCKMILDKNCIHFSGTKRDRKVVLLRYFEKGREYYYFGKSWYHYLVLDTESMETYKMPEHREKSGIKEILGREIRLADILNLPDSEAMKKMTHESNALLLWKLCRMWIKNPDNLELQSKECIEFIFNLLK